MSPWLLHGLINGGKHDGWWKIVHDIDRALDGKLLIFGRATGGVDGSKISPR